MPSRRPARRRAVELVRVRRPQRRAGARRAPSRVSAAAHRSRAAPARRRSSGSRRCAIRAASSPFRTRVVSAALGRRARGRRRGACGDRHRRRAADRLLRPGRHVPRWLARRAPRRHDRPRAPARRPRPDAGRRLRRVRAAPGCRRGPRRSPATAGSSGETVALTGVVPQISVVSGASAGGGAYSPALTDLIVMTEDAAMFLTGPGVVREALGEEIDAAALGGPRVHERNGVCHLVEPDESRAAAPGPRLLAYLPSAAGERCPVAAAAARPSWPIRAVSCPPRRRRAYDVREVLARGSSTAARCSSSARAGRATSSPPSPGSTGGPVAHRRQPAALPRRRARRRRPPRRRRGSSASATRSACR